ncbi:DNA repair ATPase [Bombiscardovia nodaiensis]|uniref:DNA repair ATPase n=1 Tax=Bombiscardovia nodaiensis TaxID=2932181 RepID=A0ABM8B9A4_9BIFI|nr:DNA repair ATPase [Bombiscardovia nodaiensis]
MADETVTTPENISQSTHEPEQPSDQAAAASPASTPASKPSVPSPAAFAKKAPSIPPAVMAPTYKEEDLKAARAFGRVDDKGSVFVREGDQEREVGQFPDAANQEEALDLYAHRYLDLKEKLDLFAQRLKSSNIKAKEIDDSLKSLDEETQEPAVVGNIAALRAQLAELMNEGAAKKTQLDEERKVALDKAIAERTAIVEQAEALIAGLGDSTNWRQTADKLRSLFDQWQEHQRTSVRIDKKHADELWKRFSGTRSAFNQARRKWAQERDSSRSQARQIKESIISRANELKNSTDWGATSREFNQLMDQWKTAGRAGRKDDDSLWARFREAADVFFNARQADRDKMSSDEQDNLQRKEALLVKAEALLPVKDEAAAKQARQALAKIQEEWDQIGYVPRSDMRRIESRLDAVDRQIKTVEEAAWKKSDPEADARKSSFQTQLESQLAELDQQIAQASDPTKKQALEAEKATKEQWLKAIQ